MDKFGYSLAPSSTLNLDNVDLNKFTALVAIEPDILKCMACGSCTATCSSGKYVNTSLRRAILSLRNGDDDTALKLIEGCMLCGKCNIVCPRGINTRNLIISIFKIYQIK
jgi:Heterodisulfide reductase, subunit C